MNGPQFDCSEFRKFASLWEFKHETSSPLYPQSNGKVEQAVKTAKQLMRKARHDQKDPYLAILDFRNTPTQGFNTSTSPAQRLMNRRTNTLLPTKQSLLQPNTVSQYHVHNEMLQQKQQFYYNQGTKDLQPLKNGDVVRIQPSTQTNKEWKKGVDKSKVNIRSYDVEVGQRTFRRNRRHIRQTHENFDQQKLNEDLEFDNDFASENINQKLSLMHQLTI